MDHESHVIELETVERWEMQRTCPEKNLTSAYVTAFTMALTRPVVATWIITSLGGAPFQIITKAPKHEVGNVKRSYFLTSLGIPSLSHHSIFPCPFCALSSPLLGGEGEGEGGLPAMSRLEKAYPR